MSEAGIYASVIALAVTFLANGYCVLLLLKTRNRFKHRHIVDLGDLGFILYGPKGRRICRILLIASNVMYLFLYEIFFSQ